MFIQGIIEWSAEFPDWRSDALRRIWTRGEVHESDIAEVIALLKLEFGISLAGDSHPTARRFTKEDVSAQTPGGPTVVLKSIHDVVRANALAPGQRLDFATTGLSIVYGDNATGKSGYSRILKKICRARGEPEMVLPNVLATPVEHSPASALIDYRVADEDINDIKWVDGTTIDSRISEVAVFDSRSARAQVNERNRVEYQPYGVDELQKLVQMCNHIRERIVEERDSLPLPLPEELASLFEKGRLLERLSSATKVSDLILLTEITTEQAKRAQHLRRIVAERSLSDPSAAAELVRKNRKKADEVRRWLIGLRKLLRPMAVDKLTDLALEYKSAKEVAALASKARFESEPLPGVGSSAWKIMFDAAKRFSELNAYTESPFPVVGDGSRCVLCMQRLDEESKHRLTRFWEFISADTSQRVESTTAEFEAAGARLDTIDEESSHLASILEDLESISPDVASQVAEYAETAKAVRVSVQEAIDTGDWTRVLKLTSYPPRSLSSLSRQLESEARKYEESADPIQFARIEKELQELEDRLTLKHNLEVVLEHLGQLQLREQLQQCYDAALTTSITKKIKELTALAIEKKTVDSIHTELKSLGLGYLKLEINTTGEMGHTYQQYSIPSTYSGSIKIQNVLSEGEHRAVALASFLSELQMTENNSGIVFDDPVRSLDHKWSEHLAKRLVQEASKRQVIVFTHDVFFLEALIHSAEQSLIQLHVSGFERTRRVVGICSKDLPWVIQSVGDRINALRAVVKDLKQLYSGDSVEEYEERGAHWYDLMRQTWERLIEEMLFNKVVRRYNRGVMPSSIAGVVVEDSDYATITKCYDDCCRWFGGHDKASPVRTEFPTPDQLASDLDDLEGYYSFLKKRRNTTEKSRKSKSLLG